MEQAESAESSLNSSMLARDALLHKTFDLYLRVAVRRAQASNLGDRNGGVNEDIVLVDQVSVFVTINVGHKGLRDVQEVVVLS